MAKHKAYPEYKDSGVEWLGEIPESWLLKKVSWHFSAEKGKKGQFLTKEYCGANPGIYPVYSGQTENDGIMGTIDSYEFSAGKGGVLFSTTVGAKAMSLSHLKGKFSLSQNCMVILSRNHKVNIRFFFYSFQPLFSYERALIPEHMQASFRMEDLYQYPIAMPSKNEQLNIASFLDHETAKIDNLIEKQQQLIELLKEKRQAVISHAVTKGLDPNVPMKNSGVEWLGEVPEHWKIMKFSHCVNIRSGQVDPRKSPYDNFWLIAPNHIASGQGRIINLETAKDQGADSGKYLCKNGEVIYSKIRPALVKACISPADNVLCSADMYPMSSNNGLTNNFLLLYLLSNVFTRFAVNQADRVAMPKINRESLADCKIPIPLESEQDKIYTHTTVTLNQLDVIIQKSEFTIKLLQERRTALISAAVTGKIDVRDWVAPANSEMANIEESPEVNA
ncbi:restriction endonuclease subunit S [Pectobacterium peruviense]|uniref:restriction endonuclease subunit S n=1 Tax=Pectobacterium peruviense TaxID=2066479 RepID=UPI000DE487F6|nr:restriction endonuclease subunit S [Pectobacterium peruviense]